MHEREARGTTPYLSQGTIDKLQRFEAATAFAGSKNTKMFIWHCKNASRSSETEKFIAGLFFYTTLKFSLLEHKKMTIFYSRDKNVHTASVSDNGTLSFDIWELNLSETLDRARELSK